MRIDELVKGVAKRDDLTSRRVVAHINSYQFRLSLKILGRRIEQGMTKKRAAQRAGLSQQEYSEFENGIKHATKQEYLDVLHSL